MEEVVGQLLLRKQQTLALAESCTGGLISHRITRVAGSSAYFLGAAITYSNAEKIRALGVNPATLDRVGAVSRDTALEMSQGIRQRTGATIGLSVTGVAGPSGGSCGQAGRHRLGEHLPGQLSPSQTPQSHGPDRS